MSAREIAAEPGGQSLPTSAGILGQTGPGRVLAAPPAPAADAEQSCALGGRCAYAALCRFRCRFEAYP